MLFHVLLRDDSALDSTDTDTVVSIGEVGTLWSGGKQPIWVVADYETVNTAQVEQYRQLSVEAAASAAQTADPVVGMSVGKTDAHGVPLCLDLGPV